MGLTACSGESDEARACLKAEERGGGWASYPWKRWERSDTETYQEEGRAELVESISFPISADQVDALVALRRDQIKGILETFQRDWETFPDLRVSEAGEGLRERQRQRQTSSLQTRLRLFETALHSFSASNRLFCPEVELTLSASALERGDWMMLRRSEQKQ
jgi:hypothetical protein